MTEIAEDELATGYIGSADSDDITEVLANNGSGRVVLLPFETWERENATIRRVAEKAAITAYHANLIDEDIERSAVAMVNAEQWSSFWSMQDARALVRAVVKALGDSG